MIYDGNYKIEFIDKSFLNDDAKIYDVFFKRVNVYMKHDEKLYVRYKTIDGVEEIVCLAENHPNEYQVNFNTQQEKERFYKSNQDDRFYNKLKIYLVLTDEQAIDLLNIFKDKIDEYDYNFHYCDHDVVIRNIIKPNLDNSEVLSIYNSYGKSYDDKHGLEKMLNEGNNVVTFNEHHGNKYS